MPRNDGPFEILLSDHARRDIRDVLAYTHQVWGTRQRLDYKQKIFDGISALAANPRANRKKYGLYVFAFGRHLIFYDVTDTTISIVRILHERTRLSLRSRFGSSYFAIMHYQHAFA